VLDADKEGFLRSETALIQIAGRAARHLDGKVILYADQITGSMQRMMDVTERRRTKQLAYNVANHITPQSIQKSIRKAWPSITRARNSLTAWCARAAWNTTSTPPSRDLEKEMTEAADALEFERATVLRDQLKELRLAAGLPQDFIPAGRETAGATYARRSSAKSGKNTRAMTSRIVRRKRKR